MANVQLFGPFHWNGVPQPGGGSAALGPGKTDPISTPILIQQEPPESANLVFVVTARPLRTGPHVFTAGISDVSVVINDPPGGYNLNFLLVNTHQTQPLAAAVISIAAIS
jgi:hypothetical protein